MNKQILVTRASLPALDEYVEEIRDIWDSHWLTNMGIKHQKLQFELKKYLDVENIDLLTNGHMALELTLQALNLPKGGEVITTPFTFASTTHAIVRNGLKPVFCDINGYDFTLDVKKIEALITDRTCAILPVHVYGNVCDIDTIDQIAKKYGLKVIYDAAHSFGVKYRGKGIGSYGDVSCFSFHATKVFNTIEGGAVCFGNNNSDFGIDIYRLKNFGIRGPEEVDAVGANAKMNEFCAAMGLCNLRHINDEILNRKKIVELYCEAFYGVDGIQLNNINHEIEPNYAYFPLLIDEKIFGKSRNEVIKKLSDKNIFARKYFYPLTNTFKAFQGMYNVEDTPTALYVSNRVMTLPLYSGLDMIDVSRICDIILSMKD